MAAGTERMEKFAIERVEAVFEEPGQWRVVMHFLA
jgi:hypothetical protein